MKKELDVRGRVVRFVAQRLGHVSSAFLVQVQSVLALAPLELPLQFPTASSITSFLNRLGVPAFSETNSRKASALINASLPSSLV